MDLLPDDAQQEIITSTAALLEVELPIGRLRAGGLVAETLGDAQWRRFAELGWFGLGLAEEQGGVGFSLVEEALLARELGRVLAPPSLIATLLAARCAALAGDGELRDALLAGSARAAFAEATGEARLGPRVRGDFQLFDYLGASHLIAVGAYGAVLLDATSLEPRRQPCLDDLTTLAFASLDASAVAFVPASRDSLPLRATLLSAAMLVGVAEAARDQAARYANERVQFGRPIGVFQAIKHRCADMAVRCEAAWQQSVYAALTLTEPRADAAFQVASAKLLAAQAALENAGHNVQVHGGYGFTVEYDAQLLVKRAHVLDRLAGNRTRQLAAVLAEPAPSA